MSVVGSTTREYETWKKSALARFFRTTVPSVVKALRLYDELGVLVLRGVDEASGYRYDARSSKQRALVAMLRQLDLPLGGDQGTSRMRSG